MQFLEAKIPPVALTIFLALTAWLLAFVLPQFNASIPYQYAFSGIAFICGLSISLIGVYAFNTHQTTVNPTTPDATTTVVTTGIYKYTRNPMYLGFALFLLSASLFTSNLAATVVLPIYFAYMTQFQIKPEELALQEKFGDAFTAYMSRVRRWI